MKVKSINGTHVTFYKDPINGDYSGRSITIEEYRNLPKTFTPKVVYEDDQEPIKRKRKSK